MQHLRGLLSTHPCPFLLCGTFSEQPHACHVHANLHRGQQAWHQRASVDLRKEKELLRCSEEHGIKKEKKSIDTEESTNKGVN